MIMSNKRSSLKNDLMQSFPLPIYFRICMTHHSAYSSVNDGFMKMFASYAYTVWMDGQGHMEFSLF